MSDVELRYGMDGHAQFVEVGVCSACRQRPPATGEVLCEPCLAPPEHRDWRSPESRQVLAATRRWTEAEAPVTSPAEAYRSLLARRECP